jgi:hypothetical protein
VSEPVKTNDLAHFRQQVSKESDAFGCGTAVPVSLNQAPILVSYQGHRSASVLLMFFILFLGCQPLKDGMLMKQNEF